MTTARIHAVRHVTGAADLAPGYLITPQFAYSGKIDRPEMVKGTDSLINVARRVLRDWCAPAFAGLSFCPEADLERLDEALDTLRRESYRFNEVCEKMGSDRRVTIEIFNFRVDPQNLRTAIRIGQTLFQNLERLKQSVLEPNAPNEFVMEWRISKHLAKLVTGPQHSIVGEALRSIKAQREENGTDVHGPWHWSEFDRALSLYEPAAEAFFREM